MYVTVQKNSRYATYSWSNRKRTEIQLLLKLLYHFNCVWHFKSLPRPVEMGTLRSMPCVRKCHCDTSSLKKKHLATTLPKVRRSPVDRQTIYSCILYVITSFSSCIPNTLTFISIYLLLIFIVYNYSPIILALAWICLKYLPLYVKHVNINLSFFGHNFNVIIYIIFCSF